MSLLNSVVDLATICGFFTLGAGCGGFLTWRLLRRQQRAAQQQHAATVARETELAVASAQLTEQQRSAEIREELAARSAQVQQLQELVAACREQNDRVAQQQRSDNQLLQLVTPVGQTLRALQQRVEQLEQQRAAQHGELLGQLQQASRAEQQLLATSQQLAQAFSSTTKRGLWGESTLTRLFEQAGMLENVDFFSQSTLHTDSGAALRPDFLLRLPGGRTIAIDAKAPLSALLELPPAATAQQLRKAQQAHAQALRGHLKQLSSKDYQNSLADSLDLVLAFVPSDELLQHAFAADPQLHEYGYGLKVVLVSPASMFTVLKTIEYSWRKHKISKEAQEIHALSSELYRRLSVVAEHLSKLGASLKRATGEYNSLIGSLENRFLPTARRIAAIDPALLNDNISGIKELQITAAPRTITATELQENEPSENKVPKTKAPEDNP